MQCRRCDKLVDNENIHALYSISSSKSLIIGFDFSFVLFVLPFKNSGEYESSHPDNCPKHYSDEPSWNVGDVINSLTMIILSIFNHWLRFFWYFCIYFHLKMAVSTEIHTQAIVADSVDRHSIVMNHHGMSVMS